MVFLPKGLNMKKRVQAVRRFVCAPGRHDAEPPVPERRVQNPDESANASKAGRGRPPSHRRGSRRSHTAALVPAALLRPPGEWPCCLVLGGAWGIGAALQVAADPPVNSCATTLPGLPVR